MSDQAAQPQKPRDAREEWEEWTRTASAEELADGIAVEWERDHHDPHVHNLAVSERTNAYLWLRLTERLERAATDLVDASNSGTRIMARLTAVYVALTGIIAVATIVGAGATIYSALKSHGTFIASLSGCLAGGIVVVTAVMVARFWPKTVRGEGRRK